MGARAWRRRGLDRSRTRGRGGRPRRWLRNRRPANPARRDASATEGGSERPSSGLGRAGIPTNRRRFPLLSLREKAPTARRSARGQREAGSHGECGGGVRRAAGVRHWRGWLRSSGATRHLLPQAAEGPRVGPAARSSTGRPRREKAGRWDDPPARGSGRTAALQCRRPWRLMFGLRSGASVRVGRRHGRPAAGPCGPLAGSRRVAQRGLDPGAGGGQRAGAMRRRQAHAFGTDEPDLVDAQEGEQLA